MKIYTVAPITKLTMRGRVLTYVASLGVLWLFVEPASAFGVFPSLTGAVSWLGYLLLLALPLLFVPVAVRWHWWYKTHELPFIQVSIRSTADGVTYRVKVAENMLVSEALRQFLDIVRRGPGKDHVDSISYDHYPVLQMKAVGRFVDVDANVTVSASGLQEGSECQIRAQRYAHQEVVHFYQTSD